jgi:hypothetical protein
MSIQLVGWALETPCGSPSRKAVLVALANCQNHHTGLCCPSLKRLAAETEFSKATVIRALVDLETMGLIVKVERKRKNGSDTSNEYLFPLSPVTPPVSHGATPGGITVRPPEPEVEPEVEPSAAPPPETNRPPPNGKADRDRIWDALTDIFGPVTTRTGETLRGKHVSELAAAHATPPDILARAKAWPLHFDSATLTAPALVKHWDTLGRKPLRRR